jgi:hypothetical protein
MEHNVMGGPRRGVMSARWSMRPSTYDRMMRGSNQCRYYENSGYFNFGSVWLMPHVSGQATQRDVKRGELL